MKYALPLLFALVAMVSACDNEVDLVNPGDENMVIYCLLNHNDSIHYVKVNRVFSSETRTALEMAKDVNELFFDTLRVTMTDLSNGQVFVLNKETIRRDEGTFGTAINYVYAVNTDIVAGRRYRIEATNPLTGDKAYAETQVLNNTKAITPSQNLINSFEFRTDGTGEFPLIFEGDNNHVVYEVMIRLIYEEIDQNSSTLRRDTVVWPFTAGRFGSPIGSTRRTTVRTASQLFYDYVGQAIEQKPANIYRRALALEFEYWTGDNEMATYIDVFGTASIGVVQKSTDYTNVNGGYGLVASRNNIKITGTTIAQRNKDELRTNPATARLNFQN